MLTYVYLSSLPLLNQESGWTCKVNKVPTN